MVGVGHLHTKQRPLGAGFKASCPTKTGAHCETRCSEQSLLLLMHCTPTLLQVVIRTRNLYREASHPMLAIYGQLGGCRAIEFDFVTVVKLLLVVVVAVVVAEVVVVILLLFVVVLVCCCCCRRRRRHHYYHV